MLKTILHKGVVLAIAGAVIFTGPSIVCAKDGAGTTVLPFLNIPVGGRPGGMGTAYAGLADDAMGLTYTPAGSAFASRSQVAFQQNVYMEGINSSYLAFIQPIGEALTVGLFTQYQTTGDIPRTLINTSSATPISMGEFDANDLLVGLNASYRFTREISFGANLKYIRSKIEEEDASVGAIDLGVRYNPPMFPRLKIGSSLSNIGGKIKYIQEEEDLPLTWRTGFAYDVVPNRLTLAADGLVFKDGEKALAVGVEWWAVQMMALRVGYSTQSDVTEGLTAGAGIRYQDLDLDYAYMPFDEFGGAHRISLNYRFGLARPEQKDFAVHVPILGSDEEAVESESQTDTSAGETAGLESSADSSSGVKTPEMTGEAKADYALYENFMRRGDESFAKGDLLAAAREYEKAARFAPNEAQAPYNRAVCLYRQGDYAGAAESYRRAAELDPSDPNVRLYLGFSEYKMGRTDEAVLAWRDTLRLDPSNATALNNLEALGAL